MKTRRQKFSDDSLIITRRSTRLKTSENGEESSFPIPIDLTIEIFSRLPVKSIAACRCVSKLWASVLRRPDFTDLFLTKSSTRPRLLVACRKEGDLLFFSSPQIQNPEENSSPLVVNYHMKFSFDGFGCINGYYFEMGGLVNGLFGLVDKQIQNGKKVNVPVICNPSTGQSLSFPRVKTRRVEAKSFFGYDPIGKQIKVLSMTRATYVHNFVCGEHQVMTLGTGRLSWRMIDCCIPLYDYPQKKICINGVLYFPSYIQPKETYILTCFDLMSEKFRFISVEESLSKVISNGEIMSYNGKLGFLRSLEGNEFPYGRTKSIELFVLEDLEKEEWSEHIYAVPLLWENVVGDASLHFVGVIGTNVIVLSSFTSLYLYYFNIEKNSIARVAVQGMDMFKYNVIHIFLDHVEDVKLM